MIQRKIVYIIYIRNVWICKKIECPVLRNSTGNSVHYMYVMSGFAEKLNVLNSINSTENSLHYTYGMFGFEEKLIAIAAQIQWEIVYIIRTECLNL